MSLKVFKNLRCTKFLQSAEALFKAANCRLRIGEIFTCFNPRIFRNYYRLIEAEIYKNHLKKVHEVNS